MKYGEPAVSEAEALYSAINVIMEQEITLRDVANYLDNIGIQFLATIGSAMLRGWRIEMSLQTQYILSFKA